VQTNVVRQDGHPGADLVLKNASLHAGSGVRDSLDASSSGATDGAPNLKMTRCRNQSIITCGAVRGVVREGIIAAALKRC